MLNSNIGSLVAVAALASPLPVGIGLSIAQRQDILQKVEQTLGSGAIEKVDALATSLGQERRSRWHSPSLDSFEANGDGSYTISIWDHSSHLGVEHRSSTYKCTDLVVSSCREIIDRPNSP